MPKLAPHRFLPLKSQWFHILLALAGGEQSDYAITQEVLAQSGAIQGPWSAIVHRSVASAIKRLAAAGLIEESGEPRQYRLTSFGRQVLDAECERLDELVRAVRMKQAKAAQ